MYFNKYVDKIRNKQIIKKDNIINIEREIMIKKLSIIVMVLSMNIYSMNVADTRLFDAVRNNNTEKVKELIDQGSNVNVLENKRTPIFDAIEKNNPEIVKLLIDSGADLEIRDSVHNTPLFLAIDLGYKDIIKLLLDNGAKANVVRTVYRTPLHVVAMSGEKDKEIADRLIKAGANINAKDLFDETPLHRAAMDGSSEFVEFLLSSGADKNIKNAKKETAADLARKNKKTEVKDLIDKFSLLNIEKNQ